MSLAELIASEDDLVRCWELTPVLSRQRGDLTAVISSDAIIDALQYGGLRTPYIRMVRDGENLPESDYTSRVGEGPGALSGLVSATKVADCTASRATLIMQGLRLYMRTVDQFCRTVGGELGHEVHANAYLSPPHAAGAGPHYDYHSVFIRQIEGSKSWRLTAASEKWPQCRFGRNADLTGEVLMETTLQPGDSLYVPRGVIHEGWTTTEPSLHLTISMKDPLTVLSLLVEAIELHGPKSDERLRQTLPPHPEARRDEVVAMLRSGALSLRRILDTLDLDGLATVAEAQCAESAGPDPHRSIVRALKGVDT